MTVDKDGNIIPLNEFNKAESKVLNKWLDKITNLKNEQEKRDFKAMLIKKQRETERKQK